MAVVNEVSGQLTAEADVETCDGADNDAMAMLMKIWISPR